MSTANEQGRVIFGHQPPDDPWPPTLVVPPRDYTPAELAARKEAADKQASLEGEAMKLVRREQRAALARSAVSDLFVVAGIVGLAAAGFIYAVWLGVVIASLGSIIVGVAIDPPVWRKAAPKGADAQGPGTKESP